MNRLSFLCALGTAWAPCAAASAQRPSTRTTLPDGATSIRSALGVEVRQGPWEPDVDVESLFEVHYGLSDRLQWGLPLALSYGAGKPGDIEWIASAGVTSFGLGYGTLAGLILSGSLGVAAELRRWIASRASAVTGIALSSGFHWSSGHVGGHAPTVWRWQSWLGFIDTVIDRVTLAFGLRYAETILYGGEPWSQRLPVLVLGSVPLALRSVPVLQLHVTDVVSIDAHVNLTYDMANDAARAEYLLGATFVW